MSLLVYGWIRLLEGFGPDVCSEFEKEYSTKLVYARIWKWELDLFERLLLEVSGTIRGVGGKYSFFIGAPLSSSR